MRPRLLIGHPSPIDGLVVAALAEKFRAKGVKHLHAGNALGDGMGKVYLACARRLRALLPKEALAIERVLRLKPGARVEHQIFGTGTVERCANDVIAIKFDHHGTKELSVSFTAGKLAKIAKRGK